MLKTYVETQTIQKSLSTKANKYAKYTQIASDVAERPICTFTAAAPSNVAGKRKHFYYIKLSFPYIVILNFPFFV